VGGRRTYTEQQTRVQSQMALYLSADLSGGNPYDYQRILVLPGAQHMSGTLALEYVRARHDDAYGDFARSQAAAADPDRAACQDEHVSLADIPSLATSLGSNFQTDMRHRSGERTAAGRRIGAAGPRSRRWSCCLRTRATPRVRRRPGHADATGH